MRESAGAGRRQFVAAGVAGRNARTLSYDGWPLVKSARGFGRWRGSKRTSSIGFGSTAFYQAELPRLGFAPLPAHGCRRFAAVAVSVRVANKEEVLVLAGRARVEIGSWFESPLHPAGTRMEAFGYREGMCPEAEAASREVVNLPTHRKVSPAVAERTLEFLRKQARSEIMMKRLLDIVAAGLGLVVLSPVLALVALLVKCGSPGPIFFRHERMGKSTRPCCGWEHSC